MPISITGTGTVTGISVGGLPDAIITSAELASGAARANFGAGAVLQVASTTKTDTFTTTSTSFTDVTGLSVSITPSSASSKILVMCNVNGSVTGSTFKAGLRLLRDSTAISIGDASGSRSRGFGQLSAPSYQMLSSSITFLDSPSSTSSITYKIQLLSQSGSTAVINRTGDDADQAETLRTVSSITVMEIAG